MNITSEDILSAVANNLRGKARILSGSSEYNDVGESCNELAKTVEDYVTAISQADRMVLTKEQIVAIKSALEAASLHVDQHGTVNHVKWLIKRGCDAIGVNYPTPKGGGFLLR